MNVAQVPHKCRTSAAQVSHECRANFQPPAMKVPKMRQIPRKNASRTGSARPSPTLRPPTRSPKGASTGSRRPGRYADDNPHGCSGRRPVLGSKLGTHRRLWKPLCGGLAPGGRLLQVDDRVAVRDLVAGLDVHSLDDAGPVGPEALAHLHRLQQAYLVARDDLVSFLDRH